MNCTATVRTHPPPQRQAVYFELDVTVLRVLVHLVFLVFLVRRVLSVLLFFLLLVVGCWLLAVGC